MKRSKSSRRWLQEHVTDPFVKAAQVDGYRSRAVYKLQQIQEKDKIFHEGMVVVDLGAAPGGWSQVALEHIGQRGKVFALDILEMEPLADVEIIQGDFTEQAVLDELLTRLNGRGVDLVLSDMAPNISGNKLIDQPRSMYLAELCLDLAQQVLCNNGAMLVKLFQGGGFDAYVNTVRSCFRRVVLRKPEASRARSKEVYLLATGYNSN